MAQRTMGRPPAELLMRYWLPAFLYMGMIQFLGSRKELNVPMIFPNADKVVHMLEYGGFGALLARSIRASSRVPVPVRTALIAVGAGFCVGALDEFVQSFVPGRTSSMNDLLADVTGLLLAQFVFLLVVRD